MKHLFLLGLLAASQALAHHGWSEYEAGKPLELSGTIAEAGYMQPHGFVRLKTPDKEWTVILAPPTRMQARGLDKGMLAVGKQVSVLGYPHRSEQSELRAERITVDGKTTELR